jgi:hypothetical protein
MDEQHLFAVSSFQSTFDRSSSKALSASSGPTAMQPTISSAADEALWQPLTPAGPGGSQAPSSLSSQKLSVSGMLSSGNFRSAREAVYGEQNASVLEALERAGLSRGGTVLAMAGPSVLASPAAQAAICKDADDAADDDTADAAAADDDTADAAADAAAAGAVRGSDSIWSRITGIW